MKTIAAIAAALVLFASVSRGQTSNATLVGDVKDATGAFIPDAQVTVTNTATGVSRSVRTGANGAYRVYPVSPGTYDLSVQSTGFKTQLRPAVGVEVGSTVKVDFALELGQVSETVEVTAAAPVLQTQDASVGGTVTNTEIARIPVNGRNYTRLILMMPGTSDQRKSQSRGTFSGTELYSVNGARAQDNNFTLDGVDNNMMMMNSPGGSPPMDAIQEFRVATNTSAEYGRSAGANVNIAIKSGTRDLHGSAYEYFRNDKLDANDFFANRNRQGKVPYRQNQYGVSLGGPMVIPKIYNGRDKTFWFFNWEGYRERRGQTNLANYPTAEQRAGNFSGVNRNIYDPLTGTDVTVDGRAQVSRLQFPGNVIPANRINPAIKFFLDELIPLPNRPGLTNNYLNTRSRGNDRDIIIARGDHHLSEKDNFSFRFMRQHVGESVPNVNPHLGRENRFDTNNYMGNWTHVFNPTSVLEVRFGYNQPWNPGCDNNTKITRQEFLQRTGIQMFFPDVLCSPIPNISAIGEFGLGGGGDTTGDKIWQTVANFSKVVGRHSIKFGVNYSRRHFFTNTSNPMNGNADFDRRMTSLFSDAGSGHSTASMLLGYPSGIRRATGFTITNGRINAHQYFLQDDWRVTSKLTLNLGIRYEFNNAPYDTSDQLGNLQVIRDPTTGKYEGRLMWATVNPEVDPVTGERNQPARTFGYGRALMRSDFNNFAPRLGIAYQVNEKTVVRTGFGMFYNTTFVQELQDLRKFWPYTPQQLFSPNTGTLPDLSVTDAGPPYSSTAAIGGWPQNPDNRSPYSLQWNFFIQRELMKDLSWDIGYVGSSTRKQVGYTAINAPLTPGPGAVQPRRLLSNFGDIDGGANRFGAQYNALQTSLNQRFRSGMQIRANYTWSKSMDDQSSLAEWKTQDPFNMRADWSRSSWDITHVFQVAYVYELPFGRNKRWGSSWAKGVDLALGGWSIEGFTRMQTGAPVNVVSGTDRANVGRTYQRPNVSCNPNNGPRTPDEWFSKSCFSLPAIFEYGNAGAFFVNADGRHNWDMSIMKQFFLNDQHKLQFRTELFNAFNHVKMGNPSSNFSALSFAQVASATPARRIQFVLRYEF